MTQFFCSILAEKGTIFFVGDMGHTTNVRQKSMLSANREVSDQLLITNKPIRVIVLPPFVQRSRPSMKAYDDGGRFKDGHIFGKNIECATLLKT